MWLAKDIKLTGALDLWILKQIFGGGFLQFWNIKTDFKDEEVFFASPRNQSNGEIFEII